MGVEQKIDKRSDRFSTGPGAFAAPPGINAPASFHEAHYVAHIARARNYGVGAPFATEADGDVLPKISAVPPEAHIPAYASQPGIPPVGRPGNGPLPTEALDKQDSFNFARAVQEHARQ